MVMAEEKILGYAILKKPEKMSIRPLYRIFFSVICMNREMGL